MCSWQVHCRPSLGDLLGLQMLFGNIVELRVYYETYPVAFLLMLHTVLASIKMVPAPAH